MLGDIEGLMRLPMPLLHRKTNSHWPITIFDILPANTKWMELTCKNGEERI